VGVDEKNRSEILSRILADLFVKSKEGEGLSSKIQHLRDELKKVIESEDTIFGKFRGLVESFREIIPDEKQRYHAAIQALSTTSKLNQQEIVKAVNDQIEELKILEKGLMPALPGWRDEFKLMEVRSREMRDEISRLREKIEQLEREEKGILTDMASREKEMELVEKAVGKLFTDLGAEITSIKKKVEEFTAENAASQPTPAREAINKSDIFPEGKGGGERKSEIPGPPAPQDEGWQRKCPMCGGRMDFYAQEEMWQCYSCAYEAEREPADAPQPPPASKPGSGASPLRAAHTGSLSSNENQEPRKGSSLSINQPSSKKKTCPVCRKKMDWYQEEKTWRCPFCGYERSI
jgi:ribosomal protein L37AE/L43A